MFDEVDKCPPEFKPLEHALNQALQDILDGKVSASNPKKLKAHCKALLKKEKAKKG